MDTHFLEYFLRNTNQFVVTFPLICLSILQYLSMDILYQSVFFIIKTLINTFFPCTAGPSSYHSFYLFLLIEAEVQPLVM